MRRSAESILGVDSTRITPRIRTYIQNHLAQGYPGVPFKEKIRGSKIS
jgi:hypothetical protein